jgi:UDP-glucose 4-epimerase
MPDRVVVLGANGYLGRHLVRELADLGADVLQSGRAPDSVQALGTYVQADVRDRDAIGRLVQDAAEIYVAAGATGTAVGFERYEEFLELNELGLLHVLDAVRRTGSRAVVVFPSTRLVYRGRPGRLAEDAELAFLTPYAINKFAGEQLPALSGRTFAGLWAAFRVGVAYGEDVPGRRASHGTVTDYVERARSGEDLVVFGDGAQRRTLTHVADVARAMIAGARDARARQQVLNVGGPDELSIREIATAIATTFGVAVVEKPWPELAKRIESGDTVLDASRLEAFVGRQYLRRFHKWLRDNATRG